MNDSTRDTSTTINPKGSGKDLPAMIIIAPLFIFTIAITTITMSKEETKASIIPPKQIDVEFQYQEYLKKVNLKEKDMGPRQQIETRNAFFAGFGTSMVVQSHGVAMMKTETQRFEKNVDLLNQVSKHFQKATERYDAQRN